MSVHGNIMESPTVLVLGAGASEPYGFPLGSGLKSLILNQAGSRKTKDDLVSLGFDETLIDDFSDVLRYGSHPTIDIFLEKKTNFRELGSYLIASTLMPLENHDRLFPQRDWYGTLFEVLDFENEKPDASLLSIVTLNYERSLEHFLNMNINYNCQHKLVDFAHEKREKIEVVHAHGSFGKYPDVYYGTQATTDGLKNAAASIKIVSDRLDDSPDFQKAQEIISRADHIILLGFGYDERTLSALLAKTDIDKKLFYGTGFGIDDNTVSRLKGLLGDTTVIHLGQRCTQFLEAIGMTGKHR